MFRILRSETAQKALIFLATAVVVFSMHRALASLAMSLSARVELVESERIFIFFEYLSWSGDPAWGWSHSHHDLAGVIVIAWTLPIVLTLLHVAPWSHRSQFMAICLFCAGVMGLRADYTLRQVCAYFFVFLPPGYSLPAFSLLDVTYICALAYLVLLTIRRFFSKAGASAPLSETPAVVGDPLFEKRHSLRLLIGVELFSQGLLAVGDGLSAAGNASEAAWMWIALLSLLMAFLFRLPQLAAVWFLWAAVPSRRVDVLVLRAYAGDRGTLRFVRRLRKRMKPLRVTGASNPSESRSLLHLPYWIFMPFIFALGENHRINVFRHNIYLGQDWQAGIRALLASVQAAVFDCRTVSDNLAWEVEEGLKTLGAARCFFILPVEGSEAIRERLFRSWMASTPGQELQCFTEDQTDGLVAQLRALESGTSPASTARNTGALSF